MAEDVTFVSFITVHLLLLCLENRTKPISTPYDGRCLWDSNLHEPAYDSPALFVDIHATSGNQNWITRQTGCAYCRVQDPSQSKVYTVVDIRKRNKEYLKDRAGNNIIEALCGHILYDF